MENNTSPISDFNFDVKVPEHLTHESAMNQLLDTHEQRLNKHDLDIARVRELAKEKINHAELFVVAILSGGIGSILTYIFQS